MELQNLVGEHGPMHLLPMMPFDQQCQQRWKPVDPGNLKSSRWEKRNENEECNLQLNSITKFQQKLNKDLFSRILFRIQ